MDYSIFNAMLFPVCVIGADGQLLFKNETFESLIANDRNSVSLDLDHPFYPEYRKRIALAYHKALSGNDTKCFAVMRSVSGEQMPVEIYLYPMKLESDVPAILAFFKQVDDRMLSFNRSAFPVDDIDMIENVNIFEFSPFPIIRYNEDNSVRALSASVEDIIGCSRDKIMQHPEKVFEVMSPYDSERIKKAIYDLYQGEISFKRLNEIKITTQREEEKKANAILYPVVRGKKIVAVEMLLEDITKLKRLEDKLSFMNGLQILGDLSKGLLHSFSNILNIVISRSQMLLQLSEKKTVVDGLHVIHDSAMEGARQIRRVQDFIGEKNSDEIGRADLIELIEDAIEFARIHFKVEKKEKGRSISIVKQYFAKAQVEGNIKLLREVIISIIFKVSSFIAVEGIIEIELRERGDFFFSVHVKKQDMNGDDSMQPIDKILPKVDIRRIAEKINIRIFEEESSEIFSIRAAIPSKMIVKLDKEEESINVKLRDLDILVVEDEPALREVLFELLDSMGNRVFVCDDGEAGILEFRERAYDIVISDYGIPGITGLELLSKVKAIQQDVITVLLSGWGLKDLNASKNIVDLYLPKPFQLEILIKEISRIMQGKHA